MQNVGSKNLSVQKILLKESRFKNSFALNNFGLQIFLGQQNPSRTKLKYLILNPKKLDLMKGEGHFRASYSFWMSFFRF